MHKQISIQILIAQILLISAIENIDQKFPKIEVKNGPWTGNGTIQMGNILQLECTAPYSIYWDYIPSEMSTFQVNSSIVSEENGKEFIYTELLEVRPYELTYFSLSNVDRDNYHGRSGNYTCKSTLNSTLSNSLFVYCQDNNRIFSTLLFLSTFSKLVNGSEWIIPCPANLETSYLNVSLTFAPDQRYYLNGNTTYYDVPISENETSYIVMFPGDANVRYDSRYGFLLNKTVYSSRPSGQYVCHASTNSSGQWSATEKVVINITNFNVNPKTQFVTYTNKTEIIVTCEADDEVYINTENTFMLRLVSSSQKLDSENFKWSVTNRFEEKADPLAVDNRVGEISCRIKSSDTVLHIWKHDIRKSCHNVSIEFLNNSKTLEFTVQYFNHDNTSMIVESNQCTTKWKCDLVTKYFDKLGKNELMKQEIPGSLEQQKLKRPLRRQFHHGSYVFKCTVENYTTTMEIRADTKDIEGLTVNVTSSHIRLGIDRSNNYDIYVGDRISLQCEAATYFYRRGFLWKAIYKNGSEVVIKRNDFLVDQTYISLDLPIFNAVYSFNVTDPNISQIICEANLWNTTSREIVAFPMSDVKDFKIWDQNAPLECNDGLGIPKIALSRSLQWWYFYDENSDEQPADHIVTNSDIQIKSSIRRYRLTCIAAYPLKFFMEGEEHYSHWYYWNRDPMEGFGNMSMVGDSAHHCFKEIYTQPYWGYRGSGEYRCQHYHDPNIYSTVYVYSENDYYGHSLIDAGRHKVVSVNIEQLEVYLPCRVNNPNISVSLYVHEDQGKYRLVKSSEYISYSPKKGFLMETASVSLTSVYICTTAANNTQRRSSNSIYLTFEIFNSATENVVDKKDILPVQQFTFPSDIRVGFFFVLVFFIAAVILLLGFLKKQIAFQEGIRKLIGGSIRMESNSTATFNELDGSYTDITARLISP